MAYTPMIQQYLSVKAGHKDAFLFYRLGDFYEMFFEDATRASQILEITLTSRDAGMKERIPMCGVPHHAAKNYIDTLVQKGYKVAICEQTEDPKHAKGVVRREVVQVVTPGTIMDGKNIDQKSNLYIAAAETSEMGFTLAYLDLSTGEANATYVEGDTKDLFMHLQSLHIKELVVSENLFTNLVELADAYAIVLSIEDELSTNAMDLLEEVPQPLQHAAQRLLHYLEKTQMRSLSHIQQFGFIETHSILKIDANSKRNLELIQTLRGETKGSLLWLLDDTVTAMGGRKMKQWIHQPLASKSAIEKRLQTVTDLMELYFERLEIQETLKQVYDLERLAGRIAFGSVGGRDLAQLRESLRQIPLLKEQLTKSGKAQLMELSSKIDECEDIEAFLSTAITDHPPISIKEGDVIRKGFNDKLDEYRFASRNGKDWIAQLEQKEREITGVKNLKIGYNRVFGYYIEMTKSNVHLADLTRYDRKQTLANAERFITEELKEKEAIILNAQEKSLELEYELFTQIREKIKPFIPRIQQLASSVSEIDVFASFASVSERYQFTLPTFHDGQAFTIKNGRHPVVEKMMNKSLYVPNDCVLSDEENMLLITGPNMSGKSTYMRQVALITVMAQIGCYVPADEAVLPITDQIFTRIGAADDLAGGQSTFMVEMIESQHAIVNATKRSLLLFDEIGRGTSTYDGMALAQAMMEYIHENIGANTLFSTHYHELTALEQQLSHLRNVHVSAAEQDGNVVFLHKVKEGPADKSYGIHVAQLAELPDEIIERSRELLAEFESTNTSKPVIVEKIVEKIVEVPGTVAESSDQLTLFAEESAMSDGEKEVIQTLKSLNLLGTSPIDLVVLINNLQQKLTK